MNPLVPTPEVLDAARIEELRQVDRGAGKVLARIVAVYLAQAPQQQLGLRPLALAGDFAALGLAAHSLKGSSASLGAARVAQVCQAIELAAMARNAAPLDGLLGSLDAEFAAATQALQQVI